MKKDLCQQFFNKNLTIVLYKDLSLIICDIVCSLGAHHDGQDGLSSQCSDDNYVMAAYSGSEEFLKNRFLFGCCSQRSFYGTLAE